MDYSQAVDTYYAARPAGTAEPEVVVNAGPARRLRDACEPIAMHAVWSPGTNAALAAEGLDALTSYVGGRAASMGSPVADVVCATFAWLEPGLICALYDAALATVARQRLIDVRDEAATASLREVLDGADPTEIANLVADAVESAEGMGRPLFSGLRARGRPADPVHRLWWACDLVREHRGDSHIAAAAAAGIGPVQMNILTELWVGMPLLSYTGTRGWSPEVMQGAVDRLSARGWVRDGALTDAGRAVRREIEARTDAQEQSVVDALGTRLDQVCVQLNTWSSQCIQAGAFPADILKRAAG